MEITEESVGLIQRAQHRGQCQHHNAIGNATEYLGSIEDDEWIEQLRECFFSKRISTN
jgi:hypothetical protein